MMERKELSMDKEERGLCVENKGVAAVSRSVGELKGTQVAAGIVPFTGADRYATHDEQYGRGGYRSVASTGERDAIPAERRKEGMLVNVIGDGLYELRGGVFVRASWGGSGSGSGGGAVTGGGGADLGLEVATGRNKAGDVVMYFRVNEVVKNGFVQFVRRVRKNVKLDGDELVNHRRVKYAVRGLCVKSPRQGVDVSVLESGRWYEYPLKGADLVRRYEAGQPAPGCVDRYRFAGAPHAQALTFDGRGNNTAVLKAGLQYNVLEDSFLDQTSGQRIFRQRGEVVKVNVRMTKRGAGFGDGVKVVFAVE